MTKKKEEKKAQYEKEKAISISWELADQES